VNLQSAFEARKGVLRFRNHKFDPPEISSALPSAKTTSSHLQPPRTTTSDAIPFPSHVNPHVIRAPSPPPPSTRRMSRVDEMRSRHTARRGRARLGRTSAPSPAIHHSPPSFVFAPPSPDVNEAADALSNVHLGNHSLAHRGRGEISSRQARMYRLDQCECGNRGGGGVWFA